MPINQLGKSGNSHDIAASFLVFLSLLASVLSFGAVFLPSPALRAYEKSNNFIAQISLLIERNPSGKSDPAHFNPKFSYRSPDKDLSAELDKIWKQLNAQYIKNGH